jgi:CHAD domain-containing protein
VERSIQNPNDGNLHALRISGKRMVYVTKGLSEVLGVGGEDVTEYVTVLQKFLGRQHDHVVTALAMGRVGMGNPHLKDLADTLSAEELKSADDCARAWVPLWEAVRERHLRRSLLGD